MPNLHAHREPTAIISALDITSRESNWYAVRTMARHEKRVAAQFEKKRVCWFLPFFSKSTGGATGGAWWKSRCLVAMHSSTQIRLLTSP